MRLFIERNNPPVRFLRTLCFFCLMFFISLSPGHSSHISSLINICLSETPIILSPEPLNPVAPTSLSLTQEEPLASSKEARSFVIKGVCVGIILGFLFFLVFLFFRTRRINRRFLILKKQHEELTLLASGSHENHDPNHSCLFKVEVPSSRLVDSIFVKTRERMVKIPLNDILYIQADRNYCCLHTREKEFLVVMPLKELYEKLSSDHFLRIHRSFVINLSHVQEIGTGHVVIERKTLPLSKTSKEELLKHLQTL